MTQIEKLIWGGLASCESNVIGTVPLNHTVPPYLVSS